MLTTPSDMIQSRKLFNSWDTIVFRSSAVGGGATAPTWDTTNIGWLYSHNPPGNQEIQTVGIAPHTWAVGSDFCVTLRWYLTSDGAANEDVKWDLLYRGVNPDGIWPGAWTTLEETVDVSGYVAMQDIHTDFDTISGAGLEFSCMMDFRLQRDTADAADDHPHDVIMKSLSVHYHTDSFGSIGLHEKWGA